MRRLSGLGPGFNRMWAASTLSNLGDGVRVTALPLVAATLTRDPALVAGLALAQRLPWLLFALLGGALVDRLDRRKVMGYVELCQMGLIAALAAAVATGMAALPLLYAIAFLVGVGEVLFDNAAQAILPALVRREDLERANSRLHGAELVANEFVGPPLGAFLFAAAAALPFVLDTVALAAGALLVLSIPGTYRIERDAGVPPTTIWSEIKEGLGWLWRHRLLRTLAAMVGTMNMMYTASFSIFVLFALEILGVPEQVYGLLIAAGAAGGLIASATAARVSRVLRSGPSLLLTVAMGGTAQIVTGSTSSPWLVAAMGALLGYGIVLWNVITVSLRQAIVPGRLLGRVNSVYRLLAWGTMPLGAALGGFLGRVVGLRAPFLIGGAVVLVMGLVTLPVVNTRAIEGARGDGATDGGPA